MTGVGISLFVAAFLKELKEDLLLIVYNFIHVPNIQKNNPTTMAVTAYLSKTSFITEVFVISLFLK